MKTIVYYVASLLGGADDLNIPQKEATTAEFNNIINFVLSVAGVVAVIVLVVAGIQYSVSAGDPQAAARAKNAIIYAVIGLVVIGSAFTITNFIMGGF